MPPSVVPKIKLNAPPQKEQRRKFQCIELSLVDTLKFSYHGHWSPPDIKVRDISLEENSPLFEQLVKMLPAHPKRNWSVESPGY
jgi:hypothetical protein